MLKVCKCEYIVRREILVVKGKFVLLSQEMMNELRKKKKKKKKKRKVEKKQKTKICCNKTRSTKNQIERSLGNFKLFGRNFCV